MSSLHALAIDMFNQPNDFVDLPNNQWAVVAGQAYTLWLILNKSDQLGERRYIPAVGATLQVIFPRADSTTQPATGSIVVAAQSITKVALQNANDRSLFSVNLVSSDTNALVGGTVQLVLTEGTVVTSWLQNWMITKKNVNSAQ